MRCRFRQPAFLAGKIDICWLSKAQAINVGRESFVAKTKAELNGADIR